MSATLGPIHTWVFNKIKFQEKQVERLLTLDQSIDVDEVAGIVEKGSLEDIIDIKNIHGFLQIRINITEKRLALCAEKLIENGFSIERIKKEIFDFGVENALPENCQPQKAYETLNSLLVNGMPCDRIETIIETTERKVVFQENKDIHTEYWTNKKLFQILKDELINGLLSTTKITYSHLDERTFVLEEK